MIRTLLLFIIFFNYLLAGIAIKVELQWKHQFEFAGFYAALDKGYYKDIGLDVELLQRDSSIPLGEKCLNNEVQFFTSYSNIISQIQNNEPYILVANYLKRSPLALAVKKDILIPSDLKNKTIMASKEEIQSANFRKMFLENNITKNDYRLIENTMNLNDFFIGKVDAISIYLTNEPYFLRKNKTPFVIMDPQHYGGDLLYDVNLVTTKSYAKQHPNVVKSFVDATNKGWEYALKHKEEIVNLILKKYNTQNKTKEHLLFEANEIEKLMEPDGYDIGSIDLKRIEKIEKLYIKLEDSKKFIAPSEFIFNKKNNFNKFLTSKEKIWLEQHPNIILGADHSWPPFDMTDNKNQHYGFHKDLVKLLNKTLGTNIKIKAGKWHNIQNEAKLGSIEGLLGPAITPQRLKYLVFSNPYFDSLNAVFFAKKNIKKITNPKDLQKLTIGVPKGFGFLKQTKKQIPNLHFIEFDGAEKAIEAMLLEKVDAVLTDYTVGNYLIQHKAATDVHIVYVPKLKKNTTVQIGIQKEYEILKNIINKGLNEIKDNKLLEIQKKWFPIETSFSDNIKNKKISLTQAEEEFIKQHPVLTFGVDSKWAPYIITDENGILSGFEVDMLNKIQKLTGLTIKIKTGHWKDMVEQAKSGQIDGLTTSIFHKERKDFFLFSTPYNSVKYMIATAPGNPYNLKNPKDLKDVTLVVQKNNLVQTKIARLLSGKEPLFANTTTECYDMVASNKAQATIATEELWYWINKSGNHNIVPAFILPEQRDLLYSVKKDFPELKTILDKAITAIPENEKSAIKKKWLLIQNSFDKFSSLNLTYKEKTFLKKHPVIKISNEYDWAPMDFYEDGQPTGYSIEYMNLIAKKLGIKIEFVSDRWNNLVEKFRTHKIDVIHSLAKTKQMEEVGLFIPFLKLPGYFVIRNDIPEPKSIEDLYGKTAVYFKGWQSSELLKKQYPKLNFYEVNTTKEGYEALATGKADFLLDQRPSAYYMIQKNRFYNLRIAGIFEKENKTGLHIAVRKDWSELASSIQKAMDTISLEEMKYLNDKWHIGDNKLNVFSLEEKKWLKKHKKINLCVDPLWQPVDYIDENGQHKGIGSDFIKLFSNFIEHEISLVQTKNWGEVIKFSKNNRCDIVSMIAKTPNREKYLDFTAPYFISQNVIVTRGDVSYIEDINRLKHETFGVVKGYAISELLKEKYPNIKFIEVNSVKDGLEKVNNKKIFGFIDIIPTVAWHIQKLGFANLKISGDIKVPLEFTLGVKKDEPILYSIFQKAIASLKQIDKETILNRYVNIRYEKGFNYDLFYKLIFISILILLFFLYQIWQKNKLHKELKEKVEEELKKSRQKDNMIFHQNKLIAMGEMIENIAHQWRQPLSQINASVLTIDNEIYDKNISSEIIEKELDYIERMTKYMSQTIDDFRNLFDEDKKLEIFDLKDVLSTMKSIINSVLKYHNIEFTLENNLNEYKIKGYKNDLIHVLLIIVNNAKDALIQNNIEAPKISLKLYKNDDIIGINIMDNGGGIEDKNINKIFDPYFTTKHKTQGTGLGLYISKMIIEQNMQGNLEALNLENGACFNIKLKEYNE